MKRFVCLLLVLVLGLMVSSASAGVMTYVDDFSTSHNYLTGGVTGTIWDGLINDSAATAIAANGAGQLNIALQPGSSYDPNNGLGWDGAHVSAPFLYKNVDGTRDFTVQVQATGGTSLVWNYAGLMVRKDDANFVSAAFANWPGAPTTFGWNVVNGQENPSNDGPNDPCVVAPYLKLKYTAATQTFNFWSSPDGAAWTARDWNQFQSGSTDLVVPNMTGAMQVGLHFDAFANPDLGGQNGQFAGFSMTVVPEPSAIMLVLTGLVSLVVYAWRKRK